MELDTDKLIENALRDGIREGIKDRLKRDYQNPLDALIVSSIKAREADVQSLLSEALASCLNDKQFRDDIATSVRAVLAKTLVQRFGGEMEKQVNVLKSDPATRARITVAIEDIVKQQSAKTA